MHPITLIARAAAAVWHVLTDPDFGRDINTGERIPIGSALTGILIVAAIFAGAILLTS